MFKQNLFTGEVIIESTLRCIGYDEDIIDGSAAVSFYGKQSHRFLNDRFFQIHGSIIGEAGETDRSVSLSKKILAQLPIGSQGIFFIR
jgi:hypothetical protein